MSGDLATMRRVLRFARPVRGWIALAALAACVTVLASFGLMTVAGWFIAAMAIGGATTGMMNYFLPAAGIRFFAILRTGGRYSERLVSHEATFRLLASMRVWLFRRLEPLAPAGLEDQRGADLANGLQADVNTLQHAYLRLGAPLLVAPVCAGIAVVILAALHPPTGLAVATLLLAAGALIPGLATYRARAPGAEAVRARADLRVAVADLLQGATDLRATNSLAQRLSQAEALSAALVAAERRAARPGVTAETALTACAGLALWAAALLGGAAASSGVLAPALAPALMLAALASFEAIAPLPAAAVRWGEVAAAARRIFALADRTPAIVEKPEQAPSPAPRDGSLVLRDVSLRYGDAPWPALERLSLDIAEGERVALLGPSGAGKSSIARILLRFREYEGEVRFGGHDLRSYRADDLRRMIGVADQTPQLFNATLRENLAIAAPEASTAAMLHALETAQLGAYVADLPEGLETWIGEGGARLSAGLARRLVVARTLLRTPRLLILDEPTENLDADTARRMLDAIAAEAPLRSTLLITHDPDAAARFARRVVRIERGRIVA